MEDNKITDCNESLDSFPDSKFIRELELAVQNLLWISESEYPFQVVYWHDSDELSQENVLQHYGYNSDTQVAIIDLASFFNSATTEQEWHNEEEAAEVKRYQFLVGLLTNNLHNTQVYRLGEVEIDVYILGKTAHQAIAGLFTKIIET